MEMTNGAVLLAGVALTMGLAAVAVLWRWRRDRRPEAPVERDFAEPVPEAPPESPSPVDPPASSIPAASQSAAPEPEQVAQRFRVATDGEVRQCLFVVLDWPGLDTNRRIRRKLEEAGAVFDVRQRVYNIHPPRTGYRMMIANSTPPGALPPLHEEGEQPVVDGLSILVHFRNRRRVAHSPDALIDFTRAIAAIGGKILDAERREVSDEEFEQLRGARP
ncbi:cell division protein ZipA C-terminal FtsZ-binding domain-containing protein [Halomonas saccharevitans]|uniref:ZipA, C-terminal FtsZ-binding domain n=1 Tax=Halomonas saccharevitans TaxID=416872 RepID=A0A1I7AKA8_9GAMM|nr:cell division protein ZipA C-terminal FtsZ-binding domain-containing protein [Halomonas saccharevitans]SFT75372.1 ZipA, C-terminal FtsZ-binding domain [Halomonas saccharevitans]